MANTKRMQAPTRTDNKLSIRCADLDIELNGSATEVKRAYRLLRTQLTELFYNTIHAERGPEDKTLQLRQEDLVEIGAIPAPAPAPAPAAVSDNFFNMVLCEETHRKVYLIDDNRFENSFLGKSLVIEPIAKVYVDAKIESRVRSSLDLGSTLWRQITPAGKAAMFKGE
ncbi:hypothetical protein [Bradymonas sediminis]|uniref:Uncharacterized protein n=1 Tax=Bradymonas sediminis TaxID=1548548 RepID=A0A2Z4FHR4_9DELT|nr:hypothetical protein [Bradymonas sediminis]AWV88537.1 hypothetical protein DN745_03970 [Bradymonas sediminis]TDP77677.1 hypothetical protein DFR33_101587 [Bradymonas sediminis]